ncbi:MAG: flavodoxin family protein [Desulfovibrio sp.]|uniref:flavodoxin family protein n=1 Tax=Desulfovibrio sp. TaxID=885 RepID=UPI0025BCA849|nr:flavodoxin family protein [Desulfovibrio sp.]MCI7568629.1 flavodoxin family protein [Desulfovibrio sp.]
MPELLLLAASPRRDGTTDAMAHLFAAGAEDGGLSCRFLALRDIRIRPCRGCGRCAAPPHACPLSGDDAERLFADIAAADLVFWAAPIYFYGLPAHAKGVLDRAQRFWHAPVAAARRPAVAGLAAGRPRGEQLFTGATLGLRYFFPLLGRELTDTRCWRGMETPDDWRKCDDGRPRAEEARLWGRRWAQRITGATSA